MNAWFSGVDLPGTLLQVSLGENPPVQPEGRGGVLTRLGLMGLLDAARQRSRRGDILREIGLLAGNSGRYQGTIEELMPLRADPWCALPLAVVIAKLLRAPDVAARFSRKLQWRLQPDKWRSIGYAHGTMPHSLAHCGGRSSMP